MHAPKTRTIFILAVVLFLLAAISIPMFYPAPVAVLGPDGSPLFEPDGKPVVHRDMNEFYRLNTPAFIFLAGSGCLFIWWLQRVSKLLYGRFIAKQRTS